MRSRSRSTIFLLVAVLITADVAYLRWFLVQPQEDQAEVLTSMPDTQMKQAVLPGRRQDCGAKSLYVVCKVCDIPTTTAELRRLTNTTDEGTTMLDLKNAAIVLGFRVDACEMSFEALRRHLSLPGAYAVLHGSSDHFFPAVGTVAHRIRLLDPAVGIDDTDERSLRSSRYRWDGKVLLLTRARTPDSAGQGQ